MWKNFKFDLRIHGDGKLATRDIKFYSNSDTKWD